MTDVIQMKAAPPGGAPWILILAGGSGTRFWPASRREMPKHLLPLLDGGESLLRATLRRIAGLTSLERTFVVTAADQEALLAADIDGLLGAEQIIAEPVARNTAPAIALAMVHLSLRGAGPHDPVLVLPADSWVEDEEGFRSSLLRAVVAARQHRAIVTLGVPPRTASTGFGYLGLGEEEATEGEGPPVRRVLQFREKPDAETARAFVDSGAFWWNAGIFVFRLGYLWYVMGDLREDLDVAMARLGACLQQEDDAALMEEYAALPSISIDHAVMQDAPSVLVVPAVVGWSDLGSWDAVAAVLAMGEGGAGRAGLILAEDAHDNVVFAPGRTVGLIGVQGLAVVATDAAILVMPRERAQDVRVLVDRLKAAGRDDLI